MVSRILVEADLGFSVALPGDRSVNGRLTGSGTALTVAVDDPDAFSGRGDAAAVRLVADALAESGLSLTVVAPSGPLVTLGAPRPPWWQRRVTGSRHIRVEGVAALWSLARGRVWVRSTARALPSGELRPPGTLWPLAPTLLRRRRAVTTTHDPDRGGAPRLVVAPSEHPGPDERRQVFALRARVTTLGSDPRCDVVLANLEPLHAEVHHDERDEFVLLRRGSAGATRVDGGPVDRARLRTGSRVQLGEVTLSFYREEYADHGRPYGGRVGGELGHQRPQPDRPESGRGRRGEGGHS